jgi:hypothetical protein
MIGERAAVDRSRLSLELSPSGGYERSWVVALRGARMAVRVIDPKRVRYFAKSPAGWPKTTRSMPR